MSSVIEAFDLRTPQVDPVELSHRMVEAIIDRKALSISAPEIGYPLRVIALSGSPVHVCINPRVVDSSDELVLMEETCYSRPGVAVKVKRPASIRVRYAMPNGEVVTRVFEGLTARRFLHEMDHLNSVDFMRRANPYHRSKALKRAR